MPGKIQPTQGQKTEKTGILKIYDFLEFWDVQSGLKKIILFKQGLWEVRFKSWEVRFRSQPNDSLLFNILPLVIICALAL